MRNAGGNRTETSLAKFVRDLMILPIFLAGLSAGGAQASAATDPRPAPMVGTHGRAISDETVMPLQLAQSGDVEIYYDQYGRRVIVDAFTGEVLGVERPRTYRSPAERRVIRRRELGRDPNFGFLVPDD